jgi:hypothetical protein
MIFIPFSIKKCIILCHSVPPFSHLTSCTPAKSNLHFPNYLATIFNEPALQKLLTFHVPNLISIFQCLGHARESVQLWGSVKYYATGTIFFTMGDVSFAQPSRWKATTCRLSGLLIEYIHSYLSHLEAISSTCTWGCAMQWWQGPTYHGHVGYLL